MHKNYVVKLFAYYARNLYMYEYWNIKNRKKKNMWILEFIYHVTFKIYGTSIFMLCGVLVHVSRKVKRIYFMCHLSWNVGEFSLSRFFFICLMCNSSVYRMFLWRFPYYWRQGDLWTTRRWYNFVNLLDKKY